MSDTIYKSSLGAYMQSFLEQRRTLGYKALDVEYGLKTVDTYLLESGFKGLYITEQVYKGWWKSTCDQLDSTRYQKASVFSRFLEYLAAMGIDCYMPRLPRKHTSGRVPYTFSEKEMKAIFKAADNLRMKERHTSSAMISIPALIRLIYSTAVRISEALEIRIGNVNFKHHVIKLEYTKNGYQRYAPINESLEAVLRQYISYRNRLPYAELQHPDSHLFVSSQGKALTRDTALQYMHRILSDAGIDRKGDEEGPHLHCLRHSACVHSMVKLAREGKDLYCYLPVLSVFMGHRKVLDTENYLRLTQEMYPDLIKQDKTVTASINGVIKRGNLAINDED
jgi:site-specific recombinase XerD